MTGAPAGGGTAGTRGDGTEGGPQRGAQPPSAEPADGEEKPSGIPGSAAEPATQVGPQTPASAADEPATPGAQGREGTGWALLNLATALLALSMAVVSAVRLVRSGARKKRGRANPVWRILGMAAGILLPVLFFLTGDVGAPMLIADRWTPLMLILLAAQIVLLIVSWKSRSPARRRH